MYGNPRNLGSSLGIFVTFEVPNPPEGFFEGFGLDTVISVEAPVPKTFTSRSSANFFDDDRLLL